MPALATIANMADTPEALTLEQVAADASFDPAAAWGRQPLLLIKGEQGKAAPFMFQTPSEGSQSPQDTSEIRTACLNAITSYLSPRSVVMPLRKTERNPFPAISVGRARNNDVRVTDPRVSKVHAYLTRPADGSSTWTIKDAGSTNGTFVNGRQVGNSESFRLTPGDEVRFGMLETVFLDPEALAAVVHYATEAWTKGGRRG